MARENSFKIFGRITLDYTKDSLKDISTFTLLFTNLFIIYDFLSNKSNPEGIFFIYLFQSMIIFLFFGFLILSLRKFSAQGKEYSKKIRLGLLIFVIFFWAFYGIAHFMLLQPFLSIKINNNILISIGLFFLSYTLSFFIRFKAERERLEKIDIVKIFFEPAIVILPIYLCIIFGAIFGGVVALFFLFIFKGWADIIANSPLNSQEPFVYKILKELKERKIQK